MDLAHFQTLFDSRVRPELHALYLEPPFVIPGNSEGIGFGRGVDFGWYCREHALHLHLLALLSGLESTIERGQIIVHDHRMGRDVELVGAQHWWGRIGDVAPADASASFKRWPGCLRTSFYPPLPTIGPVWGPKTAGGIAITYSNADPPSESAHSACPFQLDYVRHETTPLLLAEAIRDPYCFLFKPPFSWGEAFGADIYNKITLHLHRVMLMDAPPLARGRDRSTFLRIIAASEPNATEILLERLARSQS